MQWHSSLSNNDLYYRDKEVFLTNYEKSYQKLLTLSFQIGILVYVAATAGQPSADETKKIIEISC